MRTVYNVEKISRLRKKLRGPVRTHIHYSFLLRDKNNK